MTDTASTETENLTIHGDDGNPRHELVLREGQLDGESLSYDADGNLEQKTQYANGKRNGSCEIYSVNGPLMQQQYKNDVLDGPTIIYGPPGMVAAELTYEAGRLQGEARYFSQGQLIRIARYQAGLREGLTEDFTAEGALSQSAEYKKDLLDGALCSYWKNGNVMERSQYEKGQLVGDIERFDQKGRPTDAEGKTTLGTRLESIFRGG